MMIHCRFLQSPESYLIVQFRRSAFFRAVVRALANANDGPNLLSSYRVTTYA